MVLGGGGIRCTRDLLYDLLPPPTLMNIFLFVFVFFFPLHTLPPFFSHLFQPWWPLDYRTQTLNPQCGVCSQGCHCSSSESAPYWAVKPHRRRWWMFSWWWLVIWAKWHVVCFSSVSTASWSGCLPAASRSSSSGFEDLPAPFMWTKPKKQKCCIEKKIFLSIPQSVFGLEVKAFLRWTQRNRARLKQSWEASIRQTLLKFINQL